MIVNAYHAKGLILVKPTWMCSDACMDKKQIWEENEHGK